MDFKKCPHCGAELRDLGISLSDEEMSDFTYANSLEANATTALNPNVVNKLNLNKDEVYSYFSAVFDQMAKAKFLKWVFERDFKRNHEIDQNIDLFINNDRAYSHGNL